MSIRDVIKKTVLQGFDAGNLTTTSVVVTLAIAMGIGLYIYLIYRITTKNGFYQRGFNKVLAVLPAITAGIMLAMQSSLVISLGMVGALSIVRFRNAVKDSVDLAFLFWSISMGIVIGAGLFELGLIIALSVTVLIVGLDFVPVLRAPCMLVLSMNKDVNEELVFAYIKEKCSKYKVRSRSISNRGFEMVVELQVKDAVALVKGLLDVEGVKTVNLLTHDGEVRA